LFHYPVLLLVVLSVAGFIASIILLFSHGWLAVLVFGCTTFCLATLLARLFRGDTNER